MFNSAAHAWADAAAEASASLSSTPRAHTRSPAAAATAASSSTSSSYNAQQQHVQSVEGPQPAFLSFVGAYAGYVAHKLAYHATRPDVDAHFGMDRAISSAPRWV